MTEFKIGDIVRMTKGKRGEPGFAEQVKRIGPYTDHLRYESVVALTELPTFIRTYNWTVELIERPLPTKPNTLGWATWLGDRHLARLRADGRWDLFTKRGTYRCHAPAVQFLDFTEAVLIPKDLAEQITAWAGGGAVDADRILNDLADHLKGQDDE